MEDVPHWSRLRRTRLSRRALLWASGRAGVGAVGLALVGCGGDDDEEPPEETPAAADAPTDETPPQPPIEEPDAVEAPEPEPRQAPLTPVRGGIAQLFSATEIHDRWDPHRSRFSQTQAVHSLMYNRLIRFDSVSEGTLEGDICDLPETPDEETYIFTIRPGVRFWDREPTNGRPFTAEDIRFNIQRQMGGRDSEENPDPLFYRQSDYRRTASMEVRDSRTIVLKTDGSDATYLASVHAGPWSWMTSPEAVESFGADWRTQVDDIQLNSGTGPFVPVEFTRGGDLILRRSTNWWRADGAYLDGLILRRTPNPGIALTYRAGQFDRADFPLGKSEIESLRTEFPDHNAYEFPLDTPVQLSFVISDDPESPFRDPRVGLAISLAINRFEIIDRLYLGDGRPSGPLPWFLQGWAIPEEELLTRPGYRLNKEDDLSEIQLLLASAGGAEAIGDVEIVIPDLFEGFFPGISASLTSMLERNLGLQVTNSFRSYQTITDQLRKGDLSFVFGWGPAPRQADPIDHWLRVAHTDGEGNYGRYSNAEVDGLIDRMRVTLDEDERKVLARQVQQILLESGFWVQNVANGIQLGIARPYLHLDPRALDFAWAAHHLDNTWIDTADPDYPSERTLPGDDDSEGQGAEDGDG